jgi:hypothetical protein
MVQCSHITKFIIHLDISWWKDTWSDWSQLDRLVMAFKYTCCPVFRRSWLWLQKLTRDCQYVKEWCKSLMWREIQSQETKQCEGKEQCKVKIPHQFAAFENWCAHQKDLGNLQRIMDQLVIRFLHLSDTREKMGVQGHQEGLWFS